MTKEQILNNHHPYLNIILNQAGFDCIYNAMQQYADRETERLKGLIGKAYRNGYNVGVMDELNDTDKCDAKWEQFVKLNSI